MANPTSSPFIAWKKAMHARTKVLFAADLRHPLITFGAPTSAPETDGIFFLDGTSDQDFATMSNSNRSREVLMTLDILLYSRFNGEADEDYAPSNRVEQMLAVIEQEARVTDTTWAGVVRESYLTHEEWTGYTPNEVRGGGRAVDCRATFTAKARIGSY